MNHLRNWHCRIILLLSVQIIASCRSDKPAVQPIVSGTYGPGDVIVVNEGNFQWGNSSVSSYNISSGEVQEDIFKAANNRALGDVCQSIAEYNSKIYLVINNSNKVEIVNPKDFKSIGTIKGLRSPRYLLGVNNSKAYVSDLYSNSISVIDLTTNSKVKEIPCPGWTEELLLSNGSVFVTNLRKEYVYVVNPASDLLEDSIKVGFAPTSIREDKAGKLWVLCGGNGTTVSGSIHKIDPVSRKVESSLSFGNSSDSPSRLTINGTKDTLYYLNNGVYRFPVNATALSPAPLIPESNLLFYGLGIDPTTGVIYVSDAIDYIQKGKVYRYSSEGKLINYFAAGIIPSHFYFY